MTDWALIALAFVLIGGFVLLALWLKSAWDEAENDGSDL